MKTSKPLLPFSLPRRLGVALSLSLAALASQAADATWPPDWGTAEAAESGGRSPDFDDDIVTLGDEKLYVGISELSKIRTKLGGRLHVRHRTADPAYTEYWLCYTIVDGGHSLRLWLGGDAQHFNGPDLLANYVVELLSEVARPTTRCPGLPARFTPLALDHGVELGAPAADFVAAIPQLQHDGEDWTMATAYTQKHWLVSRRWVLHVVGGRIVGVRVHAMVTS
jgi:hypothetical protein